MKDFMVDIETSGTSPDRTAMIQLAAVKFDLASGAVDTNFFNQCLSIPPWRFWDADTQLWWGKQRPATLSGIYARMRNPIEVMGEFIDWVAYEPGARFWAKPTTFDYMFVSSYCRDFAHHNPFSYREAVDVRSYLTGLAYPYEFVPEQDLEFEGTRHDALFDVLHQIKTVLHNQKKFGSRTVTEGVLTNG
jgi:hypothetical protein